MERHLLSFILGYAIGSLPTAYLVVQFQSRIDLREAGSRNVGALNSYEVTRSKLVGIIVLLVDVLKGAGAVVCAHAVAGPDFVVGAVAAVAVVIGHNYPVWLRFRGGRGLAPAAGASLVVYFPLVPVWLACWGAGFLAAREVNVANAIALILTIILALVLPSSLVSRWGNDTDAAVVRTFAVILMVTILPRLIEPVRQHFEALRRRKDPT